MRIYKDYKEALGEIKRDLSEMGIRVHTQTMQDKQIADNPDFETMELQNYIYTVVDPKASDLEPTQPWANAEFEERVSGMWHNPGEAYKLRPDVWNEFLEPGGIFSYTYPDRMGFQLKTLINELMNHPDSRQLFLSVWSPDVDPSRMGIRRVPCTLGYYFQKRKNQLHITYLQRSADFITHFQNDLYLALRLMEYIAEATGNKPGNFTHWVGSLHVYKKDLKGVF